MLEQLEGKFKSKNSHGYLLLSGAFDGVFLDANLGTKSATKGLRVTIQEKSTDNTLVEEQSFDSRSISLTGDGKYQIRLPSSTTNVISENQTKFAVFKVLVKEYDIISNDTSPQKIYNITCDGVIEKDFSVNDFDGEPKSFVGDTTSQANPLNETNTSTAAALAPTKAKGLSGKMIGLIVSIVLLLLAILVAIALFTGIFSKLMGMFGFDNNQAEQTTEVVEEPKEEPVAEEPKEEPVVEESKEEPVVQESAVQNPVSQAPATDSVTTTTTVVPCTITQASDGEIISNCSATKPKAAVYGTLAKEAFEKNRCDLGKRIFSSYGRRDANIAKSFAAYYDENSQITSNCVTKDKSQAVYWYEKAVSLGDEESKSALGKLKE